MVFSSYIFVLCFLPLSLALYFGLSRYSKRSANIALLLMSAWFYGYFHPFYLLLLACSISINYIITRCMQHSVRQAYRKAFLWTGILFNVGLIFYYKYLDFLINNINTFFKTDIALRNILLPLGISFFTFQQISYVVDCYKDRSIGYSFLEYAVYVSFFPQLVAGPIVLHNELIPQLQDPDKRKWDWDNFSVGLMIFTIGLFKKVMVADSFGGLVDWGFDPANISSLSSVDTWIVMLSYTFQIYFDFSGYSDMAIGIGRMFNLVLPQNFDSPYRALSVYDFWKRWHLTLTRFLRTYIYYPLGGNRKSKARTYINVLLVYLISGIWHGANWTFVLWGLLHGLANVIYRVIKKPYDKLFAVIRWGLTFLFINTTWLLFRSDNISQWGMLCKKLFVIKDISSNIYLDDPFFKAIRAIQEKTVFFSEGEMLFSYIVFPTILAISLFICIRAKNTSERRYNYTIKTAILTAGALVLCIVSFGRELSFIYFNF